MSVSGSAVPMFSYAQAAKGLAPSTHTPQPNPRVASPEPDVKPIQPVANDAVANQPKTQPTTVPVKALPDGKLADGQASIDSEDNSESKADSKSTDSQGDKSDALSGTENDNPSNTSKELSSPPNTNGETDSQGKYSEEDTPKTNGLEEQDKGKEIDDDWEKISIPSVPVDYKAAPPPTVNIWQQRKEAQDAKLKEQAVQRGPIGPVAAKSKALTEPARDEVKRRQEPKESTAEKSTAPQRRTNSIRQSTGDRKEQSPSQLSPRSMSKQGEKGSPSVPATGDSASWPTPENAALDERRRSTTHDKAEKLDRNPSQKKWIQMPFVPTAKFETQLPAAATARRGGRASNRGRDSVTRGSHSALTSQSAEKPETGTMGPPPVPKPSGDQDRGRKGEASRNQRANSVPIQTRRSVSNDDSATGFSKSSVIPQKDQPDISKGHTDVARLQPGLVEENSTIEASQPTSQQPRHAPLSSRKQDVDSSQISFNPALTSSELAPRTSVPSDRYKGSSRDFDTAERSFAPGREWSRGRPDSAREKSDSWRDRRDRGTERGRGGYRGRGNHSSYNSHSQTFTAPLPQNGFDSTKSYSTDTRSRQSSQPFNQTQSMSSGRPNPRSQSIPLTLMPASFFTPMQGFPQAMSPAHMDMNYAGQSGQLSSGIMDAMPYSQSLNTYAIRSMVISQLEYYFSINNLCKDLFLRKNMDSQGFVPLGVIAGFKRIQALTEGSLSHDEFRTACQLAPNVEFVTSDDGEDKMRARNIWRDFVLPQEERLPSAQNDGPSLQTHYRQQLAQTNSESSAVMRPVRSPTGESNGLPEQLNPPVQPTPYSNIAQFDGSIHDGYSIRADSSTNEHVRRSSNTSPFGHGQSPPLQSPLPPGMGRSSSHLTNGHHRSVSYSTSFQDAFPDDKIQELKVVVRDPAFDANRSELSNSEDLKSPRLRGGAGSQQQMENYKHIQFGQSSPVTDEDHTPFWTKHGQKSKVPEGPSYIHEDYLSLLHQAFSQRDNKRFDGALTVLYPFWSTFLVENFNSSMYQDFATFSVEEAAAGGSNGQSYLFLFYETLLKRRAPISERIASDIVTTFRQERERGEKGPVFEALRTTLRNGATDFKTVKRIMATLSAEEKAELGV